MYSFESRIRYSELDEEGKLTFHGILDYFQDCSSFQSEELQVGIEFLKEKQVAWVLVSWQIEVMRRPGIGEQVLVGTWPYDFKGFYGCRNFVMKDAEGNMLASAASMWVLMDLRAGRPTWILPEMAAAYTLEPALSMEPIPRKMQLPKGLKEYKPFPVRKFHLDTNQHVNNGKYILMAQEYLPEGFRIGKMRAEYRKSAVYGDVIYPAALVSGNLASVCLADGEGKPYTVIELEAAGPIGE